MTDELIVYWESDRVGRLWLETDGTLAFQYSDTWMTRPGAPPISLNLPLRSEPYTKNQALPFFSNLLPEANVRTMIARRLGISENNDFKLLEALGGDCAGALSLMLPTQIPSDSGRYEPLDDAKLQRMINDMPLRPLLSPEGDIRLSLAGAQDKLAVYKENDRLFLPHGSKPSSHILKPPIAHVKDAVENEFFVMRLAHHLDLLVPLCSIWPGKTPAFLSQRYDRASPRGGSLHRLHQEDFCQALGVSAHQKYEKEGGPSLGACFRLIAQRSFNPALDKRRTLQWVLFNYLVGNNDAHGKNLAFLFAEDGVSLAPFYDLLSTAIYPDVNQKMAMSVGGEDRSEWLTRRHWERLAVEADVAPRIIFDLARSHLKNMTHALALAVDDLKKTGRNSDVTNSITNHIRTRVNKLEMLVA